MYIYTYICIYTFNFYLVTQDVFHAISSVAPCCQRQTFKRPNYTKRYIIKRPVYMKRDS